MNVQNSARYLGMLFLLAVPAPAAELEIKVDLAKPGPELSPHLYGLFFEDINFAADGGLYAELIQNRSFEYFPVEGNDAAGREHHPLFAWELVEEEGASCQLGVADANPLNEQNPHYLEVWIREPGRAGVRNLGFDGIRLDAGARYDLSFHARMSSWRGDSKLEVRLEDAVGVIGETLAFEGVGKEWKRFEGVLTADRTSDVGRLVITTAGQGSLEMDMVSLFPQDTWKGRKNGLRKDLVEALEDLKPSFLRFPGGCIAHGASLDNVYRWKDTVGDVAERKPNWNLWGYHQTYGLGYYEYFLLCEDLNMHPLPVVPLGLSCGFRGPQEVTPMAEMNGWIDDALDLIEFANGPAGSEWGSVRAKMGHPEPFGMEFICLGNEPHDNREFRERFPLFVKAIREKHPEMKIIGTSGLGWQIPTYDLMVEQDVYSSDEHYYESPEWFLENTRRFDAFDREKPRIFIGEYASKGSTLFNALAEAAYLTGVERNGDIVDMTCYAPLFGHIDHSQWYPDLIYFDKRTVVRSANYYVQQLFACNKGDVYLPSSVQHAKGRRLPTVGGSVGFGTWRTRAEFAGIKVDGKSVDGSNWTEHGGGFEAKGSSWVQSKLTAEGVLRMSRERHEGEKVTYSLRARKLGGEEGFLVSFGGTDRDNTYWWNLGGWGNRFHGIERISEGRPRQLEQKRGRIEPNRWYDLKVKLSPGNIRCYVDGKLVHDLAIGIPQISVSSTLDRAASEVILKIVNPTEKSVDARIRFQGVSGVNSDAGLQVLSGDGSDTNTIFHPDLLRVKEGTVKVGKEFIHGLPPMSLQVLRIGVSGE